MRDGFVWGHVDVERRIATKSFRSENDDDDDDDETEPTSGITRRLETSRSNYSQVPGVQVLLRVVWKKGWREKRYVYKGLEWT